MGDRKHPPLMRHMTRVNATRPWGSLLDAGTGGQSIRWISDLETTSWTAVSASTWQAENVRKIVGDARRPQDRIVLGNWNDPGLLQGELFDTIIVDYLLGAVEGFAPYFQSYLFERLRPLSRGKIFVKGLEPYVPIDRPESETERMIWEIGRFRDACILLKGHLPYREYPGLWVVDHLKRARFEVESMERFPVRYRAKFVNSQINLSLEGLEENGDQALTRQLKQYGEALREKALSLIDAHGSLRCGHNYVIVAQAV